MKDLNWLVALKRVYYIFWALLVFWNIVFWPMEGHWQLAFMFVPLCVIGPYILLKTTQWVFSGLKNGE